MQKFVLAIAAAGSALAFAVPATAQHFPQQVRYNNNYVGLRTLQARINEVERQINRLDRRNAIRDRSADRLRAEANRIERQLRVYARNGLRRTEANDIQVRINHLQQQVMRTAARRR